MLQRAQHRRHLVADVAGLAAMDQSCNAAHGRAPLIVRFRRDYGR
jgi:hypothetical protein